MNHLAEAATLAQDSAGPSLRESSSTSYDLFISYAHADNQGEHNGKVAALVAAIRASYHQFAGEPLRDFFDVDALPPGSAWELRLSAGLRHAKMMLAVLSPSYFASAYCRKEWEHYVETEIALALPGEGIKPIYVVGHPDFDADTMQTELRKWAGDLKRRQFIEWRPFWHDGALALERDDVRRRLDALPQEIAQRLKHAEIRENSPHKVPSPSSHFVGRRDEMHRLREQLVCGQLGAITAVHGIPGIGKSMLAFAYAWGYGHEYPGGRFYIRAAGLPDLASGVRGLADDMNVPLTDDERKQPEVVLAKVKAAFEQGEPSLLVIDNVDDAKLLSASSRDHALPRGDHIHVLVTTRVSPEHLPNIECLPLDRLATDDGRALLNSLRPIADTPQDDEWKAAGQIVHRLSGHALMVEVVAVYLRDHPDVSYRRFYEYLEREGIELLDREVAAHVDPNALVSHTETCLTRLLEPTLKSLTPEELRAVEYAALLPADMVPLPWLRDLLRADFSHLATESLSDPTLEILQRLARLRLIVPYNDKSQRDPSIVVSKEAVVHDVKFARMHRLVEEVVFRRSALQKDHVVQKRKFIVHAFARTGFLQTGWIDWANRWEIEPLAVLSKEFLSQQVPAASELATVVATLLQRLTRFAEAESLMYDVLAIDAQIHGLEHPNVARDLSNLALIHRDTNRLGSAELLLRRAVAIDEKSSSQDDPDVASRLNNLALILVDTNRLAEAEPLLRRALAINEKVLGLNDTNVARDLNNLASLLRAMNLRAEAEPLMRRALAIDEKSYGPEHPEVATALNNLAQLLMETNRLTEAEPLMHRALAIDEKSYGPEHPKVAIRMNNLAQLFQKTNRLALAEPLMRQVLAIHEKSSGPHNRWAAIALNNLAQLLKAMNRLDEAEPLLRRAVTIIAQIYAVTGHALPNSSDPLDNYVGLLTKMGRSPQQACVELDAIVRSFGIKLSDLWNKT